MNFYYTHWYNEFDPMPNAFTKNVSKSYVPENIFTKGEIHNILRLQNIDFNLVKDDSKPFIYHCNFRLDNRKWLQPFQNYVSEDTKSKLINNGMLVFTDDEGYDTSAVEIKEKCVQHGVPIEKVLLITGNQKCVDEQTIPTLFYSKAINDLLIDIKYNLEVQNSVKECLRRKPKKFLCSLSGNPSINKVLLTNELVKQNLIEGNYVTFRKAQASRSGAEYLNSIISPELEKLLPLEDKGWHRTNFSKRSIWTLKPPSHCELSVVLDTGSDGKFNLRDVRHRIFHLSGLPPVLLLKKPFILHASCPKLHLIKSLGFKTFDELWDESYDLELDEKKKAKSVVQLILHIKKNPELISKAKNITEYNYKRFFELDYNKKITDYLYETLY